VIVLEKVRAAFKAALFTILFSEEIIALRRFG
jgi:hypothetical protein